MSSRKVRQEQQKMDPQSQPHSLPREALSEKHGLVMLKRGELRKGDFMWEAETVTFTFSF
jgi:hypothetical protein